MSKEHNEKPAHRFNFIYTKLVEKPDDLVGLLAYGIYKREKIGYIEMFKARNNKEPDPAELHDFHDLSMARIGQYRALAETQMANFQRNMLDSVVEQLNADYNQKLKSQLSQARTGWWAAITQSFIGSVVFTLFIGMIVLILLGMRSGVGGIVQEFSAMLGAPGIHSNSTLK